MYARAVVVLGLLVAICPGCRREHGREAVPAEAVEHEAAPATPKPTTTTSTSTSTSTSESKSAPAPAPAPADDNAYVGSEACASCHLKETRAWQHSWHSRALAAVGPRAVVGNFGNAHFGGASSEAWMHRRGAGYLMRTRGPDGAVGEFPVQWLIGGKRMQDSVTVFPDGRWQVLPVYFHVTGHEWVDYTEAKQGALTPDHPFYWTNFRRMANHECLDCHSTGLRVDYDGEHQRWQTTFADAGVGCESCHGPGGKHADSELATDIVQPAKVPAEVGLAICAQCHGPRNPTFPLLDAAHHFHPGQRYDDFYDPIEMIISGRISGDFFADGRPRTSSFEYQALVQSACYRKGGATCLSCHTAPHAARAGARDELKATDPDQGCRGCHAAEVAAGRAHTHHAQAAAQRCVSCHMPPVVSGVGDHFADHSIDVPSPDSTARHGVPSACGVCHADRTPAALSASLTAWWPAAAQRQARRTRLGDAFDDATAAQSAPALAAVIGDPAEAATLRGAAAVLLAMRFGPRATTTVLPLLASADTQLRAKACEAMAIARGREAIEPLAALLGDHALRVRQAAALGLQAMNDPRGEAALHQLADGADSDHLLQPHLVLGPLLARRGDLDGARRELEWVARLTPYYAEALLQLAQVAARQGDRDAARSRVDQVLRLDPTQRDAQQLRAHL